MTLGLTNNQLQSTLSPVPVVVRDHTEIRIKLKQWSLQMNRATDTTGASRSKRLAAVPVALLHKSPLQQLTRPDMPGTLLISDDGTHRLFETQPFMMISLPPNVTVNRNTIYYCLH